MRNPHAWNLLALDVPNLLPESIPWVKFRFPFDVQADSSEWLRPAGRLIWATVLFVIGLIAATGIDEAVARDIGLRVYKVAMSWPLEPQGALPPWCGAPCRSRGSPTRSHQQQGLIRP